MHFGLYLVRKGVISAEQFVDALERQIEDLIPIGQLAIKEGMLSMRQLFEVLRSQADLPTDRFGDAAIELGFLTKHDLAVLLKLQSDLRRPLADILIDAGVLTDYDMQAELLAFRRARERQGRRSSPRCRVSEPTTAELAI